MKKSRKNMMLVSLTMLIVATMSLSTATFAWFSSGKAATVSDVRITATTAEGMQISLDAENWSSSVDLADLTPTTNGAQDGSRVSGEIAPVSSVGDVSQADGSKGQLKLFSGEIAGDKLKTSTAAADKNYYVFNLYFRNDSNSDQNLQFDLTSAVTDVTAAQIAEALEADSNDKIINTGVANAVRIAFVCQGTVTSGKEASGSTAATTIYEEARKLVTTAETWDFVYEPNALTHGTYAVTYRNQAETSTAKLAYNGIKIATESASDDTTKKGLAMGTGETSGIAKASTDQVVAVETTTYVADTGETATIVSMPAKAICKVTVYIWIEGQDVDCNNAESGGTFFAGLKFSVPTTTTTE